jgi:acetyl-CoA carboxylase biotin carboxylase subunit
LIAKLIVKAENREDCIQLAKRCLEEFTIEGIKTNIPLHLKIVNDPDYKLGKIDTNFILRYA